MPNIAKVLREEISRLARKEAKTQTGVLKRASAQYRRDIAVLKREVAALRKTVSLVDKQVTKAVVPAAASGEAGKFRFVAKGFRTMRKRLGLSADALAKLLNVSGLTVYNWESGKARPRKQHLPAIAAIRSMGKREVMARLERLTARKPKR